MATQTHDLSIQKAERAWVIQQDPVPKSKQNEQTKHKISDSEEECIYRSPPGPIIASPSCIQLLSTFLHAALRVYPKNMHTCEFLVCLMHMHSWFVTHKCVSRSICMNAFMYK